MIYPWLSFCSFFCQHPCCLKLELSDFSSTSQVPVRDYLISQHSSQNPVHNWAVFGTVCWYVLSTVRSVIKPSNCCVLHCCVLKYCYAFAVEDKLSSQEEGCQRKRKNMKQGNFKMRHLSAFSSSPSSLNIW